MSLWNNVTRWFQPGTKSLLGIDIGSSSIKIIEVKKAGIATLQTYGELALGPYEKKDIGHLTTLDSEHLVAPLQEILTKIKATTRNAVFAIPSSASLVFIIELPGESRSAMDRIIPNEARKYIPVPLNEVSLDWTIIPDTSPSITDDTKTAPRMIRVLVVATRKEALAMYEDIAVRAGLVPVTYELEAFSLVRACVRRELSLIAILDLGASKTRIMIIHRGALFVSQTISRGAHMITESLSRSLGISFERAEHLKRTGGLLNTHADAAAIIHTYTHQLLTEAFSIIMRYEKEYHHAVERVVLVGGGALLPGLSAMVTEQTTMEIMNSDAFGLLAHPQFLDEVLHTIDGSFALATGLALRE